MTDNTTTHNSEPENLTRMHHRLAAIQAWHKRQHHKTKHHRFTEPESLTSDKAFMALNISMATSTDKDRVEALALPYVK